MTLDEKAAAKHLTADSKPLLRQVREQAGRAARSGAPRRWTTVIKTGERAGRRGHGQGGPAGARGGDRATPSSPGIGETLELVGREETLRRLDAALAAVGRQGRTWRWTPPRVALSPARDDLALDSLDAFSIRRARSWLAVAGAVAVGGGGRRW